MNNEHNLNFFNSFYIDSKDRVNGNYYTYVMNPPGIVNFKAMALKKISLPWNVYNVNAGIDPNTGNNVLNLIYNGNPFTITLTPGNYDANTLLTQLKTQLQTVDPSFNVTYNTLTSKYTITATLAFSLLFATANNISYYKISQLLGFSAINTSTATSITSIYPINLMFTQYFDVICSQLLEFGFMSYTSNNKHSKILKRVYVNDIVPYGNINIIYDVPRIWDYSWNSKLPQLKFEIRDDMGNPLDLNNANLSIQIDVYK